MSMTDPVADFLTRVRNGLHADRDDVEMPASNFKAEIARILQEQGYIEAYEVEAARVGRVLRVTLKYTEDRKPVIQGIQRVSKPGRREYVEAGTIPKVQGGMGTTIVSTSRGVMTGPDARRAGVGGGPRGGPRRRGRGGGGEGLVMSRIGRQPVSVPDGVEINIEPELVSVKGPKGELAERKSREIDVKQEDGQIVVTRPTDRGDHRALHGLTRSLIANMVEGVTNGFEKRLEIQGVGYRANLQGNKLVLALGYSHPVELDAPDGVDFEVPQPTRIVVRGISKQVVGEVAANIRKQRPPEPYKGKGIRYEGEYVQRKVGKRA